MYGSDLVIDPQDQEDLLQVFNRGNFSTGHLAKEPNQNLIFPEKQNHMGIYLGNISSYHESHGHITLSLNDKVEIGDSISIDGETGSYTISEIIIENQNLKSAFQEQKVTLGRMKGNIKIGSKVYKVASKKLQTELSPSYQANTNLIKIPLHFYITVRRDHPVEVVIQTEDYPPFYRNQMIEYISDIYPEIAISSPTDREQIMKQFSKLGNTPYEAKSVIVDLEDNLHIAHISDLNQIRRDAIGKLEEKIIKTNQRISPVASFSSDVPHYQQTNNKHKKTISLLLESFHTNEDYTQLAGIDRLYLPLKLFANHSFTASIKRLSECFDLYVYMPTIIKTNYKNLLLHRLDELVEEFHIKGFVISNIAGLSFVKDYINHPQFDIVSNYTMNVFNSHSIEELKKLGINRITPSIELNQTFLQSFINSSSLPLEIIAYGRSVLMNCSYCLLGKTNKCYPDCQVKCLNHKKYTLKDRLGYQFPILPDNLQTVTAIYNSKITSIDTMDLDVYSLRINILDESIEEINSIIKQVKSGYKFSGNQYTNGNLNREI